MKATTLPSSLIPAIHSGLPFVAVDRRHVHHRGPMIIHTSERKRREQGDARNRNAGRDAGKVHGIAELLHIIPVADVTTADIEWWDNNLGQPLVPWRELKGQDAQPDEYVWLFGPCELRRPEPMQWPGKNTILWEHPADVICPTCGEFAVRPSDPLIAMEPPHGWVHVPDQILAALDQARRVV